MRTSPVGRTAAACIALVLLAGLPSTAARASPAPYRISPDNNAVYPAHLVRVGHSVYFGAWTGTPGGVFGTQLQVLGLWKSDGTMAGTTLVKAIAVEEHASSNLAIAPASGGLLFAGDDDASGAELWRSDGTEAGTFRLKDVQPGPGSGYPISLIPLASGLALFEAFETDNVASLWKTDGTAAGTLKVSDANFAYGPLVLDENRAVFQRTEGSLWVTDGNTMAQIASDVPILYSPTRIGAYTFLAGNDNTVWKTDGTEAGTQRVASFPGKISKIVVGTANGVVIKTEDASGIGPRELWCVDGSSGPAQSLGTFSLLEESGFHPAAVIASQNPALFIGTHDNDTSQHGVWRTDCTAAGTELVKAFPLNPGLPFVSGLQRTGSKVYFVTSGAGPQQVWRTDGNPAGTRPITTFPAGFEGDRFVELSNRLLFRGTSAPGEQAWLWAIPLVESATFDGGASGDLLFANEDGRAAIWLMNGTAPSSASEIIGAGTGWRVSNIADFNGDGKTDLVWRHEDGRIAIYLMNGTTPSSTLQILNAGGWSVAHTPDLDGDGKSDLVFAHSDGTVALWTMNGTAMIGGSSIMGAGSGWSVIRTADFDGDGKGDLLFRHADGRHAIWLMDGLTVKSTAQILNAGDWTATHTPDLDGDGKADIVWQHTDGTIAVWLMNGATMTSGTGLLGAASGWSVTRTGDFDGDGKEDLFFLNVDGRAAIYLMNGLTPTATQQILNAGGGWSAMRVQDLDGDGKADIVWQNVDGSTAVWLMNGTTMTSGTGILGPGTGWSVSAVSQ